MPGIIKDLVMESRSLQGRQKDLGAYMKLFKRFLKDDQGQSTTEYILILSVVVMVALKFKKTFGDKLSKIVDDLGGKIDSGVNDGSGN